MTGGKTGTLLMVGMPGGEMPPKILGAITGEAVWSAPDAPGPPNRSPEILASPPAEGPPSSADCTGDHPPFFDFLLSLPNTCVVKRPKRTETQSSFSNRSIVVFATIENPVALLQRNERPRVSRSNDVTRRDTSLIFQVYYGRKCHTCYTHTCR